MALRKTATVPQTTAASNTENATPDPASAPVQTAQDDAAPTLQARSTRAPDQPSAPSNDGQGDDFETGEAEVEATHETAASLPTAPSGGQIATTTPVRNDGFSALDGKTGFGSWPILKLDKTTFMVGDKDAGPEVFGVISGLREKYLYREAGKQQTENLFYSYDHQTHGTGKSVQATLKEWAAKGIKYEVKTYMEGGFLRVVKADNGNWKREKLCMLSIPPASIARLAGYRDELAMFHDGKTLAQVVTRCYAGENIKLDGGINFRPWEFEFAGYAVMSGDGKNFV